MSKETVEDQSADFVAFEQFVDYHLRDKKLLEGMKGIIVAIKTAKRELLDARAAADKAIEEKSLNLKELKDSKDALDKAKAKIKKAEESANEEAKAIVAQAKSEAQAFLGKAVLDADKQRQDAFKVKADADAYVEAKKAEALDWEAKANAAKAAHDAYKAALAG